jgi:hypothetical protein
MQKALWRSYYAGTRVWGYADRHSVESGETFNLMLSTGPDLTEARGVVEISRIGCYGESDRMRVWRSAPVDVPQQTIQITAATVGAGWHAVLDEIETQGWAPGYYTIDFIDASDGHADMNVACIVVTNPARSGDILLELSTNTWQAYNAWGGYSFYTSDFLGTNAQTVSFDRPTPADFFEFEYYLVRWLEQFAADLGVKLDYATNFDIHRDPAFSRNCKLFISGSHNEYWSLEEFVALYDRIFRVGKNTIFMGANTAYWQIRYADLNGAGTGSEQGRQLVCFKSIDDPIRFRGSPEKSFDLITMRFRDRARRPETMLMGVAYQNYFSSFAVPQIRYPYRVVRTDLPFFAGTGYQPGDPIGDVVGYEWDNTDPEGDGKRLWDAEKSRIPPLDPAAIQILFEGTPVDVDGRPGKAEAVFFRSPAGAKVFSSGSIRWAWGLGKPEFESAAFKRFNANLVRDFLA